MAELSLDESRFLSLLSELIALTPRLQNSPDVGLVPEERLPAEVVLRALEPHIGSGFIRAERMNAPGFEARPSLVLTVQGAGSGAVGFVGAHFDVVPADREKEGWERDPFTLWVGDDGTLYARGVTDCLGHVAVLTDLLAQLGEQDIRPAQTLTVVLIANEEEAPLPEIGLDYVVAQGKLEALRDGTIYWLDSADFGPTVGTGGVAMWELDVDGVTGHSGMTHNCVNALELAMATSRAMVEWFERSYPPHPQEERWGFISSSTLKATVIEVANNKITKVPGKASVQGDIRLVPFYEMDAAIQGAVDFVAGIDALLEKDEAPAGFPRTRTVDGRRGRVKLRRKGRFMEGIACDLDSPGLARLAAAITSARGEPASPFSMTGSLPLVRDLQRAGYDVQITGFGRSGYYHAPNEQGTLDHFRQGFQILCSLLGL